jgi:hypothetical protein
LCCTLAWGRGESAESKPRLSRASVLIDRSIDRHRPQPRAQ